MLAAGDRGTEQQTFVSGIFLRRATALTSGLPWRGRPSGESVQFAADRIIVLDYIEGQGQVLAYYVNELRARGLDGASIFLPHDGMSTSVITGKRLEDHLRDAGFSVTSVTAAMRIEAARRIFPRVWFNEGTTEAGRVALGYYHERMDERRDIGLGPEHDWSSHAADAFGLMAVCAEEPGAMRAFNRKFEYPRTGIV